MVLKIKYRKMKRYDNVQYDCDAVVFLRGGP